MGLNYLLPTLAVTVLGIKAYKTYQRIKETGKQKDLENAENLKRVENAEYKVYKIKKKHKKRNKRINKLKAEVESYDRYFDVVKLLTMYSIHMCNKLGISPKNQKNSIMLVIGGVSSMAYPRQLKAEINSYFSRSISKQDIKDALSKIPGNKSKLLLALENCICIDVLNYENIPKKIAKRSF